MLFRRARLKTPGPFKADLVHEFFHVLQSAHNLGIQHRNSGRKDAEGHSIWDENWFVEASAKWAESRFDPQDAGIETHPWFVEQFQPSPEALRDSGELHFHHMYAAYIWPFFMEQEGGDAAIAAAWKAIEGKTTWDELTDALNAQVPFDTKFREFAVRNLNLDLEPGDPLKPRYRTASMPASQSFPEGEPPQFSADEASLNATDDGTPPAQLHEYLPSLKADYYHFRSVDDAVGKLTFDFASLSPAIDVDVDAILKIRDKGWERRQVYGGKLTLCRAVPADRAEEVYLIVSNHNKRDGAVTGSFTVQPSRSACVVAAGTVTYGLTWHDLEPRGSRTGNWLVTLNLKLLKNGNAWTDIGGSWSLTSKETAIRPSSYVGECVAITTVSGGGRFVLSPGVHAMSSNVVLFDNPPVLDFGMGWLDVVEEASGESEDCPKGRFTSLSPLFNAESTDSKPYQGIPGVVSTTSPRTWNFAWHDAWDDTAGCEADTPVCGVHYEASSSGTLTEVSTSSP
jgi:hypothetical protein